MSERFPLTISYAQIAVFDPDLENPFNDWNDRQYTQGFSWREGSISFAVPDGNAVFVEVLIEKETSHLSEEPTRVTSSSTAWVRMAYYFMQPQLLLWCGGYAISQPCEPP